MKLTTFVAILVLCLSTQSFANDLTQSLRTIESEWASIYYTLPKDKKGDAYNALLKTTTKLLSEFPNNPEIIFWQAAIIATNAELQDGLTALDAVHKSRDLLLEALKLNPKTANGSAYVILGTLYYMVPKWPIAFGDTDKAKEMFQTALKINPNGIDTNYFYGDFLLANDQVNAAQLYFEKALSSPSREDQQFADNKLKEEVKQALLNTQKRKIVGAKNTFNALIKSSSLN